MLQASKKIIKYILILAVLGAALWFGIKILFPEPKPTEAYQTSHNLVHNTSFEEITQANTQFLNAYQTYFGLDQPKHLNNHSTLNTANTLLVAQLKTLQFTLEDLAFAQNSATYNVAAKNLRKVTQNLNQALEQTHQYITQKVAPVLAQQQIEEPILNSIYINLLKNNKALTTHLSEYVGYVNQIFSDLTTTYTTNPYSKTVLQIASVWQETNQQLLMQTDTETFENFAKLQNSTNMLHNFVSNRLNIEEAITYATQTQQKTQFVSSVSKANFKQLFLNLTQQQNITDYINQIENQEIKESTNNLYAFVKGV